MRSRYTFKDVKVWSGYTFKDELLCLRRKKAIFARTKHTKMYGKRSNFKAL